MIHFLRGRTSKKPLPSREQIVQMCYDKGLERFRDTVVSVYYSKEKDYRGIILKKSESVFYIVYEQLIPYDEVEWNNNSGDFPGCWQPVNDRNSYYDTVERAEKELFLEPRFYTTQ